MSSRGISSASPAAQGMPSNTSLRTNYYWPHHGPKLKKYVAQNQNTLLLELGLEKIRGGAKAAFIHSRTTSQKCAPAAQPAAFVYISFRPAFRHFNRKYSVRRVTKPFVVTMTSLYFRGKSKAKQRSTKVVGRRSPRRTKISKVVPDCFRLASLVLGGICKRLFLTRSQY